LLQSYNFIFGCNGAGEKLPLVLGFRSQKVEAGKPVVIKYRKGYDAEHVASECWFRQGPTDYRCHGSSA